MAGELQTIAENAVQAAIEEWDDIVIDWDLVKTAANNFLQAYEALANTNKINNNILSNTIAKQMAVIIENFNKNHTGQTDEKIQQMRKKLDIIKKELTNEKRDIQLRATYLLAFKFQHLYQRALEITPSEVNYVSNTGDIYKTTLKWAAITSGKNGRISSTLGKEKVYTEQLDNVTQKEKDEYVALITQMQNFFLNIDREFTNRSKTDKLQSGYFFERNNEMKLSFNKAYVKKGKYYYRILNKGDSSEGYLRKHYQLSKDIFEGIGQVDNLGAMFFEDLYSIDQKINIAGKSDKASLPGLTQYKTEAEALLGDIIKEINNEGKNSIKQDENEVHRNLIKITKKQLQETDEYKVLKELGVDLIQLIPKL